MTTIDSAELWESVDEQQEWLDALSEQLGAGELRREAEESLVGTLTTICVLSRHFEDW